MEDYIFSETTRGSRLLIHQNFMYTLERSNGTSEAWRCKTRGCNGRVRIVDRRLELGTLHNHPGNKAAVLAQSTQVNLRKRAAGSSETPRQVYQAVTNAVPLQATVKLPSYDACRKAVQRERAKDGVPNTIPESLADIEVPEELKTTTRGERFLLHDSGKDDPERILVFATDENLKHLKSCKVWYSDGTFSVTPEQFHQVYALHAKFNEEVVPFVFALLPNKTKATYKRLFQAVLNGTANLPGSDDSELSSRTMIVDFEQAVISTGKKVLGSDMKGCMFHLGQAVYRKIQGSGRAALYGENLDFSTHCKMLLALAYVPEKDVYDAWLEIRSMPDLAMPRDDPILEYFAETYVGKPGRNGSVGRPKYAIAFWNTYERVLKGVSRTTNSVEAWHKAFAKTIGNSHPPVYVFINHLRLEQSQQEITVAKLVTGEPARKRRGNDIKADTRLLNVVLKYSSSDKLTYLKNIAARIEMNV